MVRNSGFGLNRTQQIDTTTAPRLLNGPGHVHAKLSDANVSAWRKYQDIFVGSTSLWDLIRYESITFSFGNLSGAMGLLTRQLAFRHLFATCGMGCTFGRALTIRHGKKIDIGDRFIVDDHCVLDARGDSNSGIAIGDDVMIARNTALVCKDGKIALGNRVGVGTNSLFHAIGDSGVTVGNDVAIGSYCYLVGGGEYITDRLDIPVMHQGQVSRGGITIEDNVWLGARVTVLDGVTIGRDSVIGAGSVVTKDISPFTVAVGTPAQKVRDRREQQLP